MGKGLVFNRAIFEGVADLGPIGWSGARHIVVCWRNCRNIVGRKVDAIAMIDSRMARKVEYLKWSGFHRMMPRALGKRIHSPIDWLGTEPELQAQCRTFHLSLLQSSRLSKGPSANQPCTSYGLSPAGSQLESASPKPRCTQRDTGPILPTRSCNSHLPGHQYRKHHTL